MYFFIFLKLPHQAWICRHQDNQSQTEHNMSYKYSWLIIFLSYNGDYVLWLKGYLHVQSSHRGSFRKAGVFFKNETVRVTSSPAFLKTWTWEVRTWGRFYFWSYKLWDFLLIACCDETRCANIWPWMEIQDKLFTDFKFYGPYTYFLQLHKKRATKLDLHVKKIQIIKWDKISCWKRSCSVRKHEIWVDSLPLPRGDSF